MKNELFFVTGNEGKFLEVKYFIEKYEPSLTVKMFNADLFEHQTIDQKQIAIDKAIQAWKMLKKPVLVDDAAIYFDKYPNFPGTITKFIFKGLGLEGILKLVEDDNRATFLLYIAYADSDGQVELFEGTCKGKIITPFEKKAHPSLPWDDIFVPNGSDKTYSQLHQNMGDFEGFEQYGYRFFALQKFLDWYRANRLKNKTR